MKTTESDNKVQNQEMMNLQEALMMPKERLPQADYCVEYADAFVFSIKDEISFGGDKSPVVIIKKSGEMTTMAGYGLESKTGGIVGEYDLTE